MIALALLLAATPTPVAPSPTPVVVSKTLQDLARERRGRKAAAGSVTTASGTSADVPSPIPTPSGSTEPDASPPPEAPRPLPAHLVVARVTYGEVSGATIRVNGVVENSGPGAACQVKLYVEVRQDGGQALGSADAEIPSRIAPHGEAAFETLVKVPVRTRTEIHGDGHTVFSGFADGPLATSAWANVVGHSVNCPEPRKKDLSTPGGRPPGR